VFSVVGPKSRSALCTMEETQEIKTVFTSRDDRGMSGGGEAANALGPSAIVAAFFDATGVWPRKIPLTPAYARSLLSA
jgi:nicotinate dehydrogenase subunit B